MYVNFDLIKYVQIIFECKGYKIRGLFYVSDVCVNEKLLNIIILYFIQYNYRYYLILYNIIFYNMQYSSVRMIFLFDYVMYKRLYLGL